jgi:hypothetical protein
MTDSDVKRAYDSIAAAGPRGLLRRCVGDGAMIVGAALVPMWATHGMITVLGMVILGLGIFIRESPSF